MYLPVRHYVRNPCRAGLVGGGGGNGLSDTIRDRKGYNERAEGTYMEISYPGFRLRIISPAKPCGLVGASFKTLPANKKLRKILSDHSFFNGSWHSPH